MVDLEAQGEKMKTELCRYFKNPLYWIVLATGLSVRAVLAYFDRIYRSKDFWALSADFWSKIGSVTVGFLIVLVLIHLFSVDRETGTWPTISSTVYGRIHLFRNRLTAGSIAVVLGIALLVIGNFTVSVLWGRGLPRPQDWLYMFIRPQAAVLIGSIGFFILAACVCDIFKNQPAAMCICGVPFAVSYFVNAGIIKPLELFWLFRYGFFTEMMRGRFIYSAPMFWVVWYALLLFGVLVVAIIKRKERKEL